jgi:enoyl-CoA hydratase/carnithine racemase
MATAMTKLPPIALQLTKEAALQGQDSSLATGLSLERKMLWFLFSTEDKKEGMTAFVEKRPPEFKGK